MKVIKHSSASPDPIVRVDDFFNDGTTRIIGNWITTRDGNEHKLDDGDYIVVGDDGKADYFPAQTYAASTIVQNLVNEMIGKELVRDLFRTLKAQDLNDAQEGDLLTRIYPVLGTLSDGFIRGARVMCNAIPTGGQFTAGRKTYLLNKIDEAIATL